MVQRHAPFDVCYHRRLLGSVAICCPCPSGYSFQSGMKSQHPKAQEFGSSVKALEIATTITKRHRMHQISGRVYSQQRNGAQFSPAHHDGGLRLQLVVVGSPGLTMQSMIKRREDVPTRLSLRGSCRSFVWLPGRFGVDCCTGRLPGPKCSHLSHRTSSPQGSEQAHGHSMALYECHAGFRI